MRIVKLSTDQFENRDDVRRYFIDELPRRDPPGKFRVTPGRIAQGRLDPGEAVVFTHRARVVFVARAGSGLVANEDGKRDRYPNYFVVDLTTLQEADEDFREVERWYNAASGANATLIASQGWNRLPDSAHTEELWARLRGTVLTATNPDEFILPDEVRFGEAYSEGGVIRVVVNRYERDPLARLACIAAHGTACCICEFRFGVVYGPEADEYIHVHHLRPLGEANGERAIDPVSDLRPVCPNCHAVLHLARRCRSIEEVRRMVEDNRA